MGKQESDMSADEELLRNLRSDLEAADEPWRRLYERLIKYFAWTKTADPEALAQEALTRGLRDALSKLDPQEASFLARYYLEDHVQLARDLSMTPNTLRVRAHRIRRHLVTILEGVADAAHRPSALAPLEPQDLK